MESYLLQTSEKLPSITSSDGNVHVVVGSEACDLDSAASALCWAYYLSQTGAFKDATVVPLLAVVRRDFASRAVTRAHLGGECGLDERLFPFLDDVDLASLAAAGRLSLTLVDHNGVGASWHGVDDPAAGAALVRQVIDHHQRQSDVAFATGCDVVIEPVGSCATLVAERVLADERASTDTTALRMLYGAIVYDTICLSPTDGRVTPKDVRVVQAIETALGCGESERRRIYDTLCQARADLSGAVTTADLLLADRKLVTGSTTRVLVPSVTEHAQALLGRADFATDLCRAADKEHCDAVVVMTLGLPDSDGAAESGEQPQPVRHLIVFAHHAELQSWIADALLASELKPTAVAAEASPAGIAEIRVLKQVDHRQSRKLVLPLLQTIVCDFDSRDTSANDSSSYGPPASSLLLENSAAADPSASCRDAVVDVPVAPVCSDSSTLWSLATETAGSSDKISISSGEGHDNVLFAPLSTDVSVSTGTAHAATSVYDPFDPFAPVIVATAASSAGQSVAAVSSSGEGATSAAASAGIDLSSRDESIFGSDTFHLPSVQPVTTTNSTIVSDPFGLSDFLAGDVSLVAAPTTVEYAAAADTKASAFIGHDGNGGGGAVMPLAPSAAHNPFAVDPFSGDPFVLDFTSSSAVDVGRTSSMVGTTISNSLISGADPFGTSSVVGTTISDSLISGADPFGTSSPFLDNSFAVAATEAATNAAGGRVVGINPFADESAPASSSISSGEPVGGATADSTEFVETATALVTATPPSGQAAGGGEKSEYDGSSSGVLTAFTEFERPAHPVASELPCSGTDEHAPASEESVSPAFAAKFHSPAPPSHIGLNFEQATAMPAALSHAVDDARQSTALVARVGSDDGAAATEDTASAATPASSREPSLPPIEPVAAAAAYDDEAFGSLASAGSSSPSASAEGSAPSTYNFLPASAELFRLTFVQQYDTRGSSVSSLDSAVAARGSSVSSVDSTSAAAVALHDVGETAAEAEAEIPDLLSSADAGDLVPAMTDQVPRARELAAGNPAPAADARASAIEAAVALPSASAALTVAIVDSASVPAALVAGEPQRMQVQQLGSSRGALLRPSESDGGSRSSSMPGTPNNSYYDSSMFERFAAVALDGHKVVSRILQHQGRHEGALMASWSVGESAVDAPAALAVDAVGPVVPLSLSLSPQPDAYDFRSTHRSDELSTAAGGAPASIRSGSLLAVGRGDAVMPLTPANSYADSFRLPDGGWPPGQRASARDDALLQLSSSEMLQKVLLKKASLRRPDADDSFASRDATPGTESPGTDVTQSAGDGSSRRRSVDSGGHEEEDEGVFEFEHDDEGAEGHRRHAGGQADRTDHLSARGALPIGRDVVAVTDSPASSASAAAPAPVQAERVQVAHVTSSAATPSCGVDVTTAASTFVNYLASVDPLHGRLDLVTDADAEPLRAQALPLSTGVGRGDDVVQRSGHAASRSALGAGFAKRHSIAGRWEAESTQIVEGVDIGDLADSDATAAALFRRASLDSSFAARQLHAMAAAATTAGAPTAAYAGVGGPNAKAANSGSAEIVAVCAVPSVATTTSVASTMDVAAPNAGDSAADGTSIISMETEQKHAELAERIVARALDGALAILSGEAAGESAAAVANAAVGSISSHTASTEAAYATAAHSLVGRVLAEAKARLVSAGSRGRTVDDDDKEDAPGDEAEGERRYSGWMIDSVLGVDADTGTAAAASAAHLTDVVEESVVPASAGVVASAAGAGRYVDGFMLPLRPSRGDYDAGAAASGELSSESEAAASPAGLSSPSDSLKVALSTVADLETPDDGGTSADLDASILQDLENLSSDSAPSLSDKQQQQPLEIVPLDAAEDGPAEWCDVMIAGREHQVDMRAIRPYCKLLSHGGLYNSEGSVLLVFAACYFPSAKLVKNYSYVMDNLLLYVLNGIELMVPEGKDYSILYFHGATDKSQLPSMAFLKRCRDEGHVRLRKSLKGMYLVHPTMWLRSVVLCSKAIVSTKFSRKIVYVPSLEVLRKVLSLEYVTVPPEVIEFDRQKFSVKK